MLVKKVSPVIYPKRRLRPFHHQRGRQQIERSEKTPPRENNFPSNQNLLPTKHEDIGELNDKAELDAYKKRNGHFHKSDPRHPMNKETNEPTSIKPKRKQENMEGLVMPELDGKKFSYDKEGKKDFMEALREKRLKTLPKKNSKKSG